jgi:flagellar hook-associated protein 1 FlgK
MSTLVIGATGNALSIGVSSLDTDQTALNVIGQNLANINTPGYDEAVPLLTEQVANSPVGNGVTITSIERQDDPLIDAAYNTTQAALGTLNVQVPLLNQAQTYLNSGSGYLDGQFNQFYSSVQELTSEPNDTAQQQVVLNNLNSLTQTFNQASNNLDQLRSGAITQLNAAVGQVNSLTQQIADLNSRIQNAGATGSDVNDLEDQRDEDVTQLAQYVNLRTVPMPNGVVNVLGTGIGLVTGDIPATLQTGTDANGNLIVTQTGTTAALTPESGQLEGLLTFINQTQPSFNDQLNTLAQSFVQAVNTVQATGLTTAGPQTVADGTLTVSDPTAALNATGTTQLPVQSGTLTVGVTNQTTGVRSLYQVPVNAAQSLNTFVTTFNTTLAGTGVTASVTANNTLDFQAASGVAFDFAGGAPTNPSTNTLTGSSTPTLTGIYNGSSNTAYTFTENGTGPVGSGTLSLTVTNASGANVATLNIGQGYTPGTPLSLAGGVSIQMSAGTLTGGSFTYPLVSQPDTSGILAALGINTLLTGTNASDIAVNPSILGNSSFLATSTTGQAGDTSNLQRLLATSTQPLLSNGTQTLQGYYASIVGGIGTVTQQALQAQTTQQSLSQQISTQQQGVSGVDSNQEMIDMLQFQRAYQESATFLTTVNKTLDALLNIIQ